MSMAKALGLTNEQFLKMTYNPISVKNIGDFSQKMIETSELPDEPVICAKTEEERKILETIYGIRK